MKPIARVTALLSRAARGRRSLSVGDLAVNFSFVMHETSSSIAVLQAVQASQRHSRARFRSGDTILDGDRGLAVDHWISTSIGLPNELTSALRDGKLPDANITFIDRRDAHSQPVTFFRDQATLSLPAHTTGAVGVAALIVRPGGASRQLIVRGPFDWRTERKTALRAIETIIQAHAEQWMPESRLWVAPAENILLEKVV